MAFVGTSTVHAAVLPFPRRHTCYAATHYTGPQRYKSGNRSASAEHQSALRVLRLRAARAEDPSFDFASPAMLSG